MQKKSTKPFQQKLDTLTELPEGFFFDAVQSWERMEEKLTGRQTKQKKIWWYMAAAASIVLIILITYFNQQETIKPVTVKPEQTKKEQSVVAAVKSHEALLGNETKELSSTPVSTKTKNGIGKKSLDMSLLTQKTKQPELNTQINTQVEAIVETRLPETTGVATPLIKAPVKRKIIHINDLGKETFFKEQQILIVKEDKTSHEMITEDTNTSPKPWYKKFKPSQRTNNN
ncbi:MAG: hypothetical protein K2Q24_01305 [Chitinophagaceae bacterium]|nr:hypothetical protein [Chitinophagaceae bacterium]